MSRVAGGVALLVLGVAGGATHASGPDVVLYTSGQVTHPTNGGAVNGYRAYMMESKACNIGDAPLMWSGTPGLAQNLYRLHNGRMVQIGQSWVKYAVESFAQNGGCGTCANPGFHDDLAPGCLDWYNAGFNASQSHLGPRSAVNAFAGTFGAIPAANFNDLDRRLVVRESDLTGAYSTANFFFEGVYVAAEDVAAGNTANNASYRRATFAAGTLGATMRDTMVSGSPAILAWPAYDLFSGVYHTGTAQVPGEGLFYYLCRVEDMGDGTWRYDYAVFNMGSDVSGGSFSVPLPAGATPTNVGFHDVDYHSGEVYDNTDWSVSVNADSITWSGTQTFSQNANANALRWGTMYNFWFDLNVEPTVALTGCVTLGLFKPHTPDAIQMSAIVPLNAVCPPLVAPCAADFNGDTVRDVADLFAYINAWLAKTANADFNDDTTVDVADLFAYINAWLAGC